MPTSQPFAYIVVPVPAYSRGSGPAQIRRTFAIDQLANARLYVSGLNSSNAATGAPVRYRLVKLYRGNTLTADEASVQVTV